MQEKQAGHRFPGPKTQCFRQSELSLDHQQRVADQSCVWDKPQVLQVGPHHWFMPGCVWSYIPEPSSREGLWEGQGRRKNARLVGLWLSPK